MSKLSKLALVFVSGIYLYHLLFFWLFETTDSYFFFAFADFIKTGKYYTPHPYYWAYPSTIVPPFYSVFLYLVQYVNRADIVIHFFHILALFISSLFLYKILSHFLSNNFALLIAILFLLIPANLIQASSLMSEVFALTIVTIYLYFVCIILVEKKLHWAKFLTVFSALTVLLRYNFLSFFILSLALFFLSRLKGIRDFVFLFFSFSILIGWVVVNHHLNEAWGLSDSQGKHLYSRVVGGDKLLPKETDPNLQRLRQLAGNDVDLLQPSWNIEPLILTKLNGSVAKESQLLGAVALSAIIAHPIQYFINTGKNFFIIHGNGLIFPDAFTYNNRWMGTSCRTLGTIAFCKGIIGGETAKIVWNTLMALAQRYYLNFPIYVNLFLFFPALVFSLFQKKTFLRFCGISYSFGVLTAIIVEIPVYRYLYPFYPIKIVIFTYFCLFLIKAWRNFSLSPASTKV